MKIAIKSNKELKTPERIIQDGIITRKVDFFQINPETNELTLRITETAVKNDIEIYKNTFLPATRVVPAEMLDPIYALFRQNLKLETEAESLFGCEVGDFDIVEPI